MHETVFENSFRNLAAALGNNHHRHHLSLHIRRETGIRQSFNRYGLQRILADNAYLINILLNHGTCLTQLGNQRLLVLRQNIFHNNITAGHSSSNHISACLNTVRNNSIVCAVQLLYTLNADSIGTGAADFGTHLVQIVGQIDNLRFLGSIFQNSSTLSKRSCHHNIFGSTYAREIKINAGTLQSLRSTCFNIAMSLLDFYTQSLKALEMNINRTGADSAAAGHRNTRFTDTRQQRSHYQKGRTHGAHQLIRCFIRGYLGAVDIQHILFRTAFYGQSQTF